MGKAFKIIMLFLMPPVGFVMLFGFKGLWYILEIIALIFVPPLGIAMILSRWVFWAIKKKIMIDIRFIYLLFIAVPHLFLWWALLGIHFLLITLGLNGIKFSLHWTEGLASNIHQGVDVLENYAREAFGLILLWGTIIVVVLQPPLSGSLTQNVVTYGWIFALIFVPLILGAAAVNHFNGGRLAQKARQGAQKAAQGPRQARQNMQNLPGGQGSLKGTAEEVRGHQERAGKLAEKGRKLEKTGNKAESIIRNSEGKLKLLPNNFKTAVAKLVKTLPGGKMVVKKAEKTVGKAAGKRAARKGAQTAAKVGKVAARGGNAAKSVEVLPAIILIIIIAPILWGFQASLIWGSFVGYTQHYAPMVTGPAMEGIGLGGAYVNWLGDEAANSQAGVAATSGNLVPPGVSRSISQTGAKLGCMLEGPQCLRQWQLNNTVRPGSEARGERYELQISQFSLGTDTVDVAYKEAGYTLPVNFLVENTRNGLKGINARNVSYQISISDSEKEYCSTGWKNISSFDDERNYILPGLGVSPTESMEQLNLGNCELLQPSLGQNLVMDLQVQYNYASQATLYVDAMSREHRREQGIEPGFKKSETADTPVQSYINVNSPITFYETEGGDRNAVPFAARFGFETPGFNSKYRIMPESIQIADSSVTTHTDTCTGLEQDTDVGENYYEISENAKERITRRQQDRWFSSDVEPAPLRCTMKIDEDDLGQISPTGEQLIMRIDGNYTIVKEDQMTGFDVQNTMCTRFNCPMLVTEEFNESSPYNLHSTCSTEMTVDARDGCGLIDPSGSSGWRERSPVLVDGQPVTIEEGKTARKAGNILDGSGELDMFDHIARNRGNLQVGSEDPVGAPNLERRDTNSNGVIYYQDTNNPGNIQVETVRYQLCSQATEKTGIGDLNAAASEFMSEWGSRNDNMNPVKVGMTSTSCSGLSGTSSYGGSYGGYPGTSGSGSSGSGTSVSDKVNSCNGVVVTRSGNAQCYGGSFNN